MFELTREEYNSLRCRNCTLNTGRGQHSKYQPYAFSELGVSMLSSVLNSDIAIEVNISIMRAFVAVRQLLANPPIDKYTEHQTEVRELKAYIEEVFTDYNDLHEDTRMQLELINESLAELQADRKQSDKPRNPIGFVPPKE
ncbi:hypothetical protein M2133_000932 [Parabacteroides sp. PF5-6]|nr:hypothetical protein [Parabacteroides sp. PF5-6]